MRTSPRSKTERNRRQRFRAVDPPFGAQTPVTVAPWPRSTGGSDPDGTPGHALGDPHGSRYSCRALPRTRRPTWRFSIGTGWNCDRTHRRGALPWPAARREPGGTDGGRAVVTVRPGEWPVIEGAGDTDVSPFAADIDDAAVRSTVPSETVAALDDLALEDADVVVAVSVVRPTSICYSISLTPSAGPSRPPARR